MASRPAPVASPMQERAMSIHLDIMNGSASQDHHPGEMEQNAITEEDYFGADRAILQAERVRRMVEEDQAASATTGEHQGVFIPTMIPLPESPSSTHTTPRLMNTTTFARRVASPIPYSEGEELMHDSPNPFALPPPPNEMGSRFDPKLLAAQRGNSFDSTGQKGSIGLMPKDMEGSKPVTGMSIRQERPFSRTSPTAIYPSGTRSSIHQTRAICDPLQSISPSHESHSNPAMSRVFPELPTPEEYGRPLLPSKYGPNLNLHPHNRSSIIRPKTLIMPSSLANALPTNTRRSSYIPEGFSLGDKPLPPGSRSSVLENGDFSRTRPGLPLSSSRKTMRSSPMADAAWEDGEYLAADVDEDGQLPGLGVEAALEGQDQMQRRPGKLYVSR
jgi:hypothetical protein